MQKLGFRGYLIDDYVYLGLMTIGHPDNSYQTAINPDFKRLVELKQFLISNGYSKVGLSMGMSGGTH